MSHSPMISPISSRKSSSAGIHSTVLPIPIITDPSGRSTSTDDSINMNHNLNHHRHHHHRHSKLKRRRLSSSEKSIPPLGLKSYHLLYLSYILSIVLLGTLYSILTGSHLYNVYHSSTTSPSSSSSSIPNSSHYSYHYIPKKSNFYFANKKNPFNVYGVKLAWFWTSIFSLAQILVLRTAATNPNLRNSNLKGKGKRQEEEEEDDDDEVDQDEMDHEDDDEVDQYLARDSNSTRPQPNATSPVAMSVIRWFVATILWASFSIYFFGPSLMERVLILTGGQCFPRSDSGMDLPGPIHGDFCRSRIPISPQSHPHAFRTANKALSDAHFAGGVTGRWQGGHDVSGHTFLLSFSILYLLEEISPFLPYFHKSLRPYYPKRMWSSFNPFIQSNLTSSTVSNYTTQTSTSSTSTTSSSSRKEQLPNKTISSTIVFGIMALIALWSWMLLMTAVYFHSPLEKITGLLTGIIFWWLLPKEA